MWIAWHWNGLVLNIQTTKEDCKWWSKWVKCTKISQYYCKTGMAIIYKYSKPVTLWVCLNNRSGTRIFGTMCNVQVILPGQLKSIQRMKNKVPNCTGSKAVPTRILTVQSNKASSVGLQTCSTVKEICQSKFKTKYLKVYYVYVPGGNIYYCFSRSQVSSLNCRILSMDKICFDNKEICHYVFVITGQGSKNSIQVVRYATYDFVKCCPGRGNYLW